MYIRRVNLDLEELPWGPQEDPKGGYKEELTRGPQEELTRGFQEERTRDPQEKLR